jgi:hypothetical protein
MREKILRFTVESLVKRGAGEINVEETDPPIREEITEMSNNLPNWKYPEVHGPSLQFFKYKSTLLELEFVHVFKCVGENVKFPQNGPRL